jgi:hypothetical protein
MQGKTEVTTEQLLQKIGTMAVMIDIQNAHTQELQEKIKMLEETIQELSKGK